MRWRMSPASAGVSWVAAPPMATLRLRKARWAGRVWLPVLPTLGSVERLRAAGTIFVSGKWAVRSPCPRDQCHRVAE